MKPISLLYFSSVKNFGDELNLDLIEKLSGRKCVFGSANTCELVAIGSLLEGFLHATGDLKMHIKRLIFPQFNIWGSGFIAPSESKVQRPNGKSEIFTRRAKAYAARGKLSLDRMRAMHLVDTSETVLGDPGLLASMLVEGSSGKKPYKVGVIPHYTDKDSPILEQILNSVPGSQLISIQQSPVEFLKELQKCETVISSAMHGLIAADSLFIPNCWVRLSNNVSGGDYKFKDYYSAYDFDSPPCFDLRDGRNFSIDSQLIKDQYLIKKEQVQTIKDRLLQAFPYPLALSLSLENL